MKSLILPKEEVKSLVEALGEFKVYGPRQKDSEFYFDEVHSAEDLVLDYVNTIISPKKFFLQPSEVLFSFKREEGLILEESVEKRNIAILGIHPCDVNALLLLDKVFSGDFEDPYYLGRRKNAVIIALNCVRAEDTCFCTSFNSGPSLGSGYDLLLTDLGDKYLLEIGSEGGRRIADKLGKLKESASKDLDEKEDRINIVRGEIKRKVDTSSLPQILSQKMESKIWFELGEKCLACGSCTMVCPTCYCFNVVDKLELNLNDGERKRFWDSCLLYEFAEVALDGNFRRDRRARIRQFMCHKLLHSKEQYGFFHCVGCGRCVKWCPVKIDITEAMNKIRGE